MRQVWVDFSDETVKLVCRFQPLQDHPAFSVPPKLQLKQSTLAVDLTYNLCMKPVVVATMLLGCAVALAQQTVEVEGEPHYHHLLENDQILVFLLTLPTDESAFVHFRHSFLTVTLQDGEVIIWDEGKSPIQHFQVHRGETSFVWLTQDQQAKGVSGGFRNDRPGDYRNITIEFLDPAVGWSQMGNGTISPPASMFLGGALVADVLLQPGDEFPAPEKPGAELIIPLSEVHLKGANTVRMRNSIGEVAWIPAETPSKLTNTGRERARFIAVQLRPGDSTNLPAAP